MKNRSSLVAFSTFALLTACGPQRHNERTDSATQEQIVTHASVQPSEKSGAHPTTSKDKEALNKADKIAADRGVSLASAAVDGRITFKKSAIFGRTFLYGFDLQYSSGSDSSLSLIPQAMALGHVPVTFRREGAKLQVVADQTRLFESNINHPEVLVNEYDVVNETEDALTVDFERPGLLINEVNNGKGSSAPKNSWLRSLEYVADGNYILQESAYLLQDGSVQTYMETYFPRENIVPANYVALEANSGFEPLADRYRFLANEQVYTEKKQGAATVRLQTSYANRFVLSEGKTIDWYVTPNIPDEFLPAVKSGIEGWNRYFNAQLGRDVMVFKGRLPEGVKIGDPRYNVVNWDSVAQAGAAYESQASDPLTGVQSHSLVYLPLAWYNIGIQLWQKRMQTESPSSQVLAAALAPKSPEVLFARGARQIQCVETPEMLAPNVDQLIRELSDESPNGPINGPDLDTFGKRLLAAVLFHEVGHGLGLAHEFKGSLAWNGDSLPSDKNPPTYSIMDYNYYQLEQDIFTEIGKSQGPSLEYDRQIISQLYNNGKDVTGTDPVIAACADDEADSVAGGVDPLCVRYDSENNPINGVVHALSNVTDATGAKGIETKTLTEALLALSSSISTGLGDATKFADKSGIVSAAKERGTRIGSLANFYLSAGAQSVRVNLNYNNKALRVWVPNVPVDEKEFRSLYKSTLTTAFSWDALPQVPANAVEALKKNIRDAVASNKAAGASDEERAKTADAAVAAATTAIDDANRATLSKLRTTVIGSLNYQETNPFALRLAASEGPTDFETLAPTLLQKSIVRGLDLSSDTQRAVGETERLAAATALSSFASINSDAVAASVSSLNDLLKKGLAAQDQYLVRESRRLLKALPH